MPRAHRRRPDHVDRVLADWARERPALDTSPAQVIGRIGRIAALIQPRTDATLAPFGLTGAGFDVLATLLRAGPPHRLAAGRLAASTLKTSGTITARIDRLAGAGLVRREPDPDDRRGVMVALTPLGIERLDAAVGAHLMAQEEILSDLAPPERRRLAEGLSTLLSGLENPAG